MALRDLNLLYNPFGELDPEERAAVAVVEVGKLARELERPGTALQLRGACGRGKSTHLHALGRALPQAQYARVDRGGARSTGGIYLMDEADHFGPLRRWWYLRRARSVAVATHDDMSAFLRRVGFRVVDVPVGGVDPVRLRRVVERRIAAAQVAPEPVFRVPESVLERLTRRHGDDLRAIEDALYEWVYQRVVDVGRQSAACATVADDS